MKVKKLIRKERGITLIALVITIIVLLILAAVSLSMITGNEGILSKVDEAKIKNRKAEIIEKIELAVVSSRMEAGKYGEIDEAKLREELNKIGILDEDITETEGKEGTTLPWTVKKENVEYTIYENGNVTENGDGDSTAGTPDGAGNTGGEETSPTITLYANKGNEEETKIIGDIEPGSKVKLEIDNSWISEGYVLKNNDVNGQYILQNWNTETNGTGTSYELGKEITVTGNLTLYANWLEIKEGAVIPTGFTYVEGTEDTGVVISDDDENQFVWVPVDETTIKYTQDHTYDEKHSGSYTGITWTDAEGNSESVKKYGGFYIARYEAGWDDDNEATYETSEKNSTETIEKENKVPVSKAGVKSWNFISQENAKTVSEKMYENHKSVTSGLVDSYAWDTVCNFIGQSVSSLTDSTAYGNYYGTYTDDTKIEVSNTKYAWHVWQQLKTGKTGTNKWTKYAADFGTIDKITLGAQSVTNEDTAIISALEKTEEKYIPETYSYTKRLEIATGATSDTKTKNIYDLAGNMWEWTTETAVKSDGKTYAVTRGGSFVDWGYSVPVVYRIR